MKAKDAAILWNPDSNQAKVIRWPDEYTAHETSYSVRVGACVSDYRLFPPLRLKMALLAHVVTAIVRDSVDPHALHQEMLQIEEYRVCLPKDVLGPRLQVLKARLERINSQLVALESGLIKPHELSNEDLSALCDLAGAQ